jgi:hypothetical protein
MQPFPILFHFISACLYGMLRELYNQLFLQSLSLCLLESHFLFQKIIIEVMIEWVVLLCIRKVSDSSLGPETGYPDGLSGLFSSTSQICGFVLPIRPRTHHLYLTIPYLPNRDSAVRRTVEGSEFESR